MRFLVCLLSLFLTISFYSAAQVSVDSERDDDGNVLVYATNSASIPYSVILNFSTLQNMTTSGGGAIVTALARPGRSQVAKLKPTLAGRGTSYNYSFSFAKGNVYGKSKSEPIYLIPVSEGVKVNGRQMTHIENKLGSETVNDEFVGVSFRFDEPTDIVAPRKGVIAEIEMSNQKQGENLNYARGENYIEIYHEDGTLTRLSVLKAGSEKVQVGDVVFPRDIIAESAGENYETGPHVRMINLKAEKNQLNKFEYRVSSVSFATNSGNIEISETIDLEVVHPTEIIEMEMSKRERKKYVSKKQ